VKVKIGSAESRRLIVPAQAGSRQANVQPGRLRKSEREVRTNPSPISTASCCRRLVFAGRWRKRERAGALRRANPRRSCQRA